MNNQRVEFLKAIEDNLSNLPVVEVEKVMSYYNESIEDRIEDGMTEEEAVKSLGNIDDIISTMKSEISFSTVVNEKISNRENSDSTTYEITLNSDKNEYTFANTYNEIHFDTCNHGIEVKQSPDNDIHLIVYENKYEYYKITENKNLTIKYIENKGFFRKNVSFLNNNKEKAQLYIPMKLNQNIFVNSKNGAITMENVELHNVALGNKNAEIDVDDIKVRNLIIYNENSGISINNANVKDIKIDNKNSYIKVNNINSNDDINISNLNSFIDIDNVTGNNVKISNMNAHIKVKDINSNTDISISNLNSIIEFEDIDFERQLKVTNCNSSVNGKLPNEASDYKFDISTSLGSSKINDNKCSGKIGTGNKLVKVRCQVGSVNIDTK